MNRFQAVALTAFFGGATLLADFSYDQTARITGGAMLTMMKFAGAFSSKAREPMTSTIMVKGDRMVNLSRDRAMIIDLGKETITHVDLQKKTYSTMTFEQMKQQMEEMAQRMQRSSKENSADLHFRAGVKDTGQSRQVNGFNTHEKILTLTMEGTDQKSGQTGALDVTNDMWLAPDVPGYGEVRDFQRRMAEKLGFMPGQSFGAMMMRNDVQKGMADMVKEMSKLDGVPVLTVMTMGGSGTGQAGADSGAPPPSASDAANDTARNDAAARLGRLGGLAGLGGFGRKKKAEQQQDAQPASGNGGGQPGVLMELTTEASNFSSSAVDPSRFEVPGGFRQVQPDLRRGQ